MKSDLDGRTVLLVEDEYLIASELSTALRRAGANVLGPARDADSARASLDGKHPDAAILDIALAADFVYPLADELLIAGVPMVFATGFDRRVLPERFRNLPHHLKPVRPSSLLRALEAAISERRGHAGSQPG